MWASFSFFVCTGLELITKNMEWVSRFTKYMHISLQFDNWNIHSI